MQESLPQIFEYQDIGAFLADILSCKQASNPRFSLRLWSRRLGYTSPSFLSDVLHGRRRINFKLADQIRTTLPLDSKQRAYFSLLALKDTSRTEKDRLIYQEIIDCFDKPSAFSEVDGDTFLFL